MTEPIPAELANQMITAQQPPIVVSVQQPVSSGGLGGAAVWVLSWIVWAYMWCLVAAMSIFFVRSDYDFVATLEHSILIAVYPIIEVVMLFYKECIIPCYCLMDACFFDMIDKLTFWSSSVYEAPQKCGGDNSEFCQTNPQPKFMSEAWFLCGHNPAPVGGQCTVNCTPSSQPGVYASTKSD